ncbi:MAG: hypothetical protein ACREP1_11695 [Rhodanobacteraceae bacterium]
MATRAYLVLGSIKQRAARRKGRLVGIVAEQRVSRSVLAATNADPVLADSAGATVAVGGRCRSSS